MLQAAVERKFEILGEALTQMAQSFPVQAEKLHNYRRFIGFRNILIHQYSAIAHEIVWGTIEMDLPLLKRQIVELLEASQDKL
jgi:uncharacterized protein with HEPN domain